jgi:site-specific DNA recombinase
MMDVNRIDIKADHIEIRVYPQRLHDLLQAKATYLRAPLQAARNRPDDILKLKVKVRLRRVGREMKLAVHNADDQMQADPGLLALNR